MHLREKGALLKEAVVRNAAQVNLSSFFLIILERKKKFRKNKEKKKKKKREERKGKGKRKKDKEVYEII